MERLLTKCRPHFISDIGIILEKFQKRFISFYQHECLPTFKRLFPFAALGLLQRFFKSKKHYFGEQSGKCYVFWLIA